MLRRTLAIVALITTTGCEPKATQNPDEATQDPSAGPVDPALDAESPTPDPATAPPQEAQGHKPSPEEEVDAGGPDVAAEGPTQQGPLDATTRDALAQVVSDPSPDELTRNSHYWVSNERSQFLWHDTIAGIGGAYIGVGTDQNYMLAGWAKSDLLILMDFDQAIVNLHHVYRVLFEKAETPEAFVELWSEENESQVAGWLEAAYPDPKERKAIQRAHRIARQIVYARLRRLVRQYPPLGIPTFVTDAEQYAHIRSLWAQGRVLAIRGDLTADATLRQLGRALRDSGRELGLLYLSNAEQYFDYEADFRRNILSLPFSEEAIVLRTLGWNSHGFVEGEEYHYNLQGGRNFAGWMEHSRVSRSGRLLRKKTPTQVPGNSVLDTEPEHSDTPPEIAPADDSP